MKGYLYILKALADETRLRIINVLKKEEEMGVLEIARALNLEQTRLSHALKCLKNCGLVTSKENGKFRIYSLNKDFSNKLFNILDEHLKEYREHILSCNIIKNENK